MLKDLGVKDTYSSETDDLVNNFYNPVLANAVLYDRISGFFSPKVLALASRGFANFLENNGKIRLITGVQVDSETYKMITKNDRKFDIPLFDELNFDMGDLELQIEKDYLSVFAWLYDTGRLEMKIALTKTGNGMMHQKIGIVMDVEGKSVSFSGSNNETVYGWRHNIEEFKVFKNWRIASASYYASDRRKFDNYWSNEVEGARVLDIDNAVKERIIQKSSTHEDIKVVVSRIKKEEKTKKESADSDSTKKRELFDFQKEAIEHWFDNDLHSIFEMATGTGKTFTSINALKQFHEVKGYLRAIVVVPLTTLTIQWQLDIKEIMKDCRIINTSTDSNWREALQSIYLSSKLDKNLNYIVITTYAMFPKPDFTELIQKMSNDFVLVADEMHNLVTERGTDAAKLGSYKYKLGLSATPTRLWKPEESGLVAKLFGDNRFSYDISSAIKSGFLVPFYYYPIPIYLNMDEYEGYVGMSREIGRWYARKPRPKEIPKSVKLMLMMRAKIKKNAFAKISALGNLVNHLQADGMMHHALIYVDNTDFLTELQKMLTDNNILTTKFVGSTPLDDRMAIINSLRSEGIKAIVAIKCLDEGVDIPSAQKAFFLSNNTDPREYVQRLGRVLRIDREGDKQHADIYDYIVIPPSGIIYEDETQRTVSRNLIKGELIRAKFFEELALNGEEAKFKVADSVDAYGFYFEEDELEYNIEEAI